MKVTILVPVYEAAARLATAVSARQQFRADALAEAFRGALAGDVTVVEGGFDDAPATGYLLAFQVPSMVDPQLARRIVAFNEDRSSIMKRVELHGLAGAIEKQRYFEWCTRPEAERGYGLVGRTEVAARMSARIAPGPYTSAHYGMIASDTARDLPGLIAEYLKANDATP